ncbi:MAG TPA: sulfate permease [Actinotalea sp.]|nr:sulfate permease [Actinotalea sp.]
MTEIGAEGPASRGGIAAALPLLGWLPRYSRGWLPRDVLAGLTLWGLLVPETMAYAGIAGLPPQAGLYTLVASLLVYALFGTSRHLSVGPTSATAALLASSVLVAIGVATVDGVDPATYQAYASAFVLVTGLVFLAAGVAKLGFVTQFLSKPVMDGFVLGLALFVAVGQLNKLFGVEKPEGNTWHRLVGVVTQLPEANPMTVVVGASALALLVLLHRWNRRFPAGLVVLFASIALSAAFDLSGSHGVDVVGELPAGLPSLVFEPIPLEAYLGMILPAIGVLLLAYSEALGVAREFAERHGYEVDADKELTAHAAANIVSAVLGGMLAAGSMSASAVKEGAGAKTQVSNLVAWAATILTLLFLTPLFAELPEAVLAAMIIHAVWRIIAARKLQRLRAASRTEFWFGLLAMLGVVFIDVLEGMMIGLLASLAFVVYRSSRPHLAVLGRIPGIPGGYSALENHPEDTAVPGVLIVRLDGPLYYASALTVRDGIKVLVERSDPPPRALVLGLQGQADLDLTSVDMLSALLRELHGRGIAVRFADVHAAVREVMRAQGMLELIPEEHLLPTVDQAVQQLGEAGPPRA